MLFVIREILEDLWHKHVMGSTPLSEAPPDIQQRARAMLLSSVAGHSGCAGSNKVAIEKRPKEESDDNDDAA